MPISAIRIKCSARPIWHIFPQALNLSQKYRTDGEHVRRENRRLYLNEKLDVIAAPPPSPLKDSRIGKRVRPARKSRKAAIVSGLRSHCRAPGTYAPAISSFQFTLFQDVGSASPTIKLLRIGCGTSILVGRIWRHREGFLPTKRVKAVVARAPQRFKWFAGRRTFGVGPQNSCPVQVLEHTVGRRACKPIAYFRNCLSFSFRYLESNIRK